MAKLCQSNMDARVAEFFTSRPRTPRVRNWFDHLGRKVTMQMLAQETGLSMTTLYQRWRRGDRGEQLVRPKGAERSSA